MCYLLPPARFCAARYSHSASAAPANHQAGRIAARSSALGTVRWVRIAPSLESDSKSIPRQSPRLPPEFLRRPPPRQPRHLALASTLSPRRNIGAPPRRVLLPRRAPPVSATADQPCIHPEPMPRQPHHHSPRAPWLAPAPC